MSLISHCTAENERGNPVRCHYFTYLLTYLFGSVLTGLHLLYILWRNRLVRGCPYEVNVEDCGSASRVTCSGDGLSEGVVTQQFSVQIDARRAAPGSMFHVTVDGLIVYRLI